MNKFNERAKSMAEDEFGGEIPSDILDIAALAEQSITGVLQTLPNVDPNLLHEIRLRTADLVVKVCNETLYRERTGTHSDDWHSGFGTKSRRLQKHQGNGHRNGSKK